MIVALPGSEVIKLFPCSNRLSTRFQLPINSKMVKDKDCSCLRTLRCYMYPAYKCLNANNCWHLNNYEQDEFHTQLS